MPTHAASQPHTSTASPRTAPAPRRAELALCQKLWYAGSIQRAIVAPTIGNGRAGADAKHAPASAVPTDARATRVAFASVTVLHALGVTKLEPEESARMCVVWSSRTKPVATSCARKPDVLAIVSIPGPGAQ